MKNATIQIQPYHENWDNMSPTDKGRLCAKCDKIVCDATQLDDSQLLQLINESK
jgi:hypothetical protein